MATDADIFTLFMGGPAAGPQAQAMAEALRRRREVAGLQRNAGNAALITGDRVLSDFGRAQLQQAGQGLQEVGQGEGMLAQAGSQQAGRQLQEALAARQAEQQKAALDMREREFRESAAARREDRLSGRTLRQEAAGQKAEEKQEKDLADRTERLAKALPDDASAFYTDIEQIESLMTPDDIPGVGTLEGRKPDFFTGAAGLKVRQAAGRIGAAYRKLISGAGVSESEKAELNRVTGLLEGGSEAQFREGLDGMKRLYNSKLQQIYASQRPEVVENYLSRNPVLLRNYQTDAPAAAPGRTGAAGGAPQRTEVERFSLPGGKTAILYSNGDVEER